GGRDPPGAPESVRLFHAEAQPPPGCPGDVPDRPGGPGDLVVRRTPGHGRDADHWPADVLLLAAGLPARALSAPGRGEPEAPGCPGGGGPALPGPRPGGGAARRGEEGRV